MITEAIAAPRVVRTVLGWVANRSRQCRPEPVRGAAHLEAIVDAFFTGHAAALDSDTAADIAARLTPVSSPLRGFAYEGAAMALGLLDWFWPVRPRRVRRFIDGPGDPHVYMVHVGAGWATARLRRPVAAARVGLDNVIDWLAVDGYGFHEGYFHTERAVRCGIVPRGTHGYARHAFDQGLGRSLWFVEGCDPERIARTIGRFALHRRADLWSGAGLAAAYAGGVSTGELRSLRQLSGPYRPQLAQGAAFAAEARLRGGNPATHTDEACVVFGAISAASAAAVVRQMRAGLVESQQRPAYDMWRRRVAGAFAVGAETAVEA